MKKFKITMLRKMISSDSYYFRRTESLSMLVRSELSLAERSRLIYAREAHNLMADIYLKRYLWYIRKIKGNPPGTANRGDFCEA